MALNVVSAVLAGPIDLFLQKLLIRRTDASGDRWLLRQAARLVAAYLCGVPLERVGGNALGTTDVDVYSRRGGNLDLAELRKSITPEGFLSAGLSERECHQQSIIQVLHAHAQPVNPEP